MSVLRYFRVFCSVMAAGLASCSPVQEAILKPTRLANDPSSLAPASPSAAWSQADAAAIPGTKIRCPLANLSLALL
jgi:hypothetical protein